MNKFLLPGAFVLGLAALGWMAAGYLGTHPLALAMVIVIAVFYGLGALELRRFTQGTAALQQALAALPAEDAAATAGEPGAQRAALAAWLAPLPEGLRPAVRHRIEAGAGALPGPVLTPYLVGFLVLLGMLGTFLGMVATLRGTGVALQTATDVSTIRASLAAPVQGLGLAFGTSVAGVAASAMLGLMSALCRRQRLQAAQALDAAIAGPLRVHTRAWAEQQSREALMGLMQRQVDALPQLVTSLQGAMAQMAEHGRALVQQQHSSQGQLAAALERTLQQGLAENARLAGEQLQPVLQATLGGLAQEARSLQQAVGQHVQQQLDGLASRFDATTQQVTAGWQQALARHAERSEGLTQGLQAALDQATRALAQALDGTSHSLDARLHQLLEATAQQQASTQRAAAEAVAGLTRETAALHERVAAAAVQQLDSVSQRFEQQASGLQDQAQRHAAALLRGFEQQAATLLQGLQQQSGALVAGVKDQAGMLMRGMQDQSQALMQGVQDQSRTLEQGVRQHTELALASLQQQSAALLAGVQDQSHALTDTVAQAHAALQATLAAREEQRLAAWTASLQAMSQGLQQQWQQAAAQGLVQQQQICATLSATAADISAQTQAHAQATLGEIQRLMQAAAQAPQAAAEVIGQLRQQLSDSLQRDNAALAEREQLLGTLATLLQAIQAASGEQRAAIDALVQSAGTLMQRAGEQFGQQVHSSAERIEAAAAQVAAGSVDVASLGEAFGQAVHSFGSSSQQLVQQLQQIEGALGQSLARSDEQLAYYVAQARELIDLSVLSQQRIVQDLQRLAPGTPAAA